MSRIANRIILASASPRRRQLMEQAGFVFEVLTSSGEEEITSTDPGKAVMELSKQKALDVEKRIHGKASIIGADTVVACDGQILGKPADEEDALRMLHMLCGRIHQVYTGVTIIEHADADRMETSFFEKTDVEMYPVSDAQLLRYIAGGECMDKAGAYGIQGQAGVFVKAIYGDYYTVVGLPIARIWRYYHEEEA